MLRQCAGKRGRSFVGMALAHQQGFAGEVNIPLQGLREFAPIGKHSALKKRINRHSRPFFSVDIPMLHQSLFESEVLASYEERPPPPKTVCRWGTGRS
jgi:hypothetical protein